MMKLLTLAAFGAAAVSASSVTNENGIRVPADVQAKIDEVTSQFTTVDEHERFLLDFCPYLESLFAYQVSCECTAFINTVLTGVTKYECSSLEVRDYPPFDYTPSFEGELVAKILASEYKFSTKICLASVGIDVDLITSGNTGTLPDRVNMGDICLSFAVKAEIDPFAIEITECKVTVLTNLGDALAFIDKGKPLEECTTCLPCELDNGGTGVKFSCSTFDTVDVCVPIELPFLPGVIDETDETPILAALDTDIILEAAREAYPPVVEESEDKTLFEQFLCSLLGVGC